MNQMGMIRIEHIRGNVHHGFRIPPQATVEELWLTPWEAQRRRLRKRTAGGRDLAIALDPAGELADGDVLYAEPDATVIVRRQAGEVVVFRLESAPEPATVAINAVRLGHVLGNQHWPVRLPSAAGDDPACAETIEAAIVEIVVPLSLDRRVVEAVIRAHRLEGVTYAFRPATPGEATGTPALGFPAQAPAPHTDDVTTMHAHPHVPHAEHAAPHTDDVANGHTHPHALNAGH